MDEYEVLLMVSAKTSESAKGIAESDLTSLSYGPTRSIDTWLLSPEPPLPAGSVGGWVSICRAWGLYESQCLDDAYLIHQTFIHQERSNYGLKPFPNEEVINDWSFRTACARLGALNGWPLRIYSCGLGVNTNDVLLALSSQSDMWAVKATVT
jgi:hypothetical protein